MNGTLNMDSALESLLGARAAGFTERFFGRAPLFVGHDEPGMSGSRIVTAADLEDLVAGGGLRASSVRLVKDGLDVPPARFGQVADGDRPTAEPYVDPQLVAAALAEGHTLVLRSLHRVHPTLNEFAVRLSDELGHPVRMSAFITPPGKSGLRLHYDTHDVFVVQLSGQKRWDVREGEFRLPLRLQEWHLLGDRKREQARANARPYGEYLLTPGDVLYLPRGYLHAASAVEDFSVHLTVSVYPVTRHHLAQELVKRAAESEWFRTALPMRSGDEPTRAIVEIGERLLKLATEADAGELIWGLRTTAWADNRPTPIRPLTQAAAILTPATASRFRLRPGVRQRWTQQPDGGVRVDLADRYILFPREAGAALELLRSGAWLSRAALAEACPEADELLRVLLDAGMAEAAR